MVREGLLRLQLYSDLHLETEAFDPVPAEGAELLVLAGDIDATWRGYERFKGWPVPMLAVAGNHEFDGREWLAAWPALRELGERIGIRWLEHESFDWISREGLHVRWFGATRWSDFGLFGEPGRARAERAARYFLELGGTSLAGRPLDAATLRDLSLHSRRWLEQGLGCPVDGRGVADTVSPQPDLTIVVTHFAPSLRCADPRYGAQPGTASFCNDDDALLPAADVWLHGHVHCRHDLKIRHPASAARCATRVVCLARGHAKRRESVGHDARAVVDIHAPCPAPRIGPPTASGAIPAEVNVDQSRSRRPWKTDNNSLEQTE
jgi:hypothetical protein